MKKKNLLHDCGLILIRGSDVLKLTHYESIKPGFQSFAEFKVNYTNWNYLSEF